MLTHLSVSQLDMFSRCGEQYRRRYLEEEIIPPGIAARIGTGVHKAAETNLRETCAQDVTCRWTPYRTALPSAYHNALQDGVFFAPEDLPGAKKAMADGKDTAVSLATLYRRELAPAIAPVLVEEKIILDLPGVDLPIVTILDVYTEDKTLRDLKTSGKKWSEDKAHASNQSTAYREAVKQATGEYPAELLFDVLVSSKTPVLQTLSTRRDKQDTAILAKKFQLMCASINAGIFLPAQPEHWCCGPKFCGYFFTCPHIPAHRKLLPKLSAFAKFTRPSRTA